jgi:hypothetical protein
MRGNSYFRFERAGKPNVGEIAYDLEARKWAFYASTPLGIRGLRHGNVADALKAMEGLRADPAVKVLFDCRWGEKELVDSAARDVAEDAAEDARLKPGAEALAASDNPILREAGEGFLRTLR